MFIIFHHIPSYSIIFLVVGLRLLRLGAKTRRMQLWWFGKAKVIHFSAPMLTQNACGSFVLWSSWRRSMALSMGAAWRKGARARSLSLSLFLSYYLEPSELSERASMCQDRHAPKYVHWTASCDSCDKYCHFPQLSTVSLPPTSLVQ